MLQPWPLVLLLSLLATTINASQAPNGVARFSTLKVSFPVAQSSASVSLKVPTAGERAISNSGTLYRHVKSTWDAVVKDNQAGEDPYHLRPLGTEKPPFLSRKVHGFESFDCLNL